MRFSDSRKKKKKKRFSFFTLLFLLFLIGVIYRFYSEGSNKFLSNLNNTAKVNNDSSKNNKHDDEYYMNMIDIYISKMQESFTSNILNSYKNLGIVKCNGYINFRNEPNENNTRSIIGLMVNNDACDILEYDVKGSSVYAKVTSGGMTGYVAKQYLVTGDEAINIAKNNIALRGIVLVDKLRMRESPSTNAEVVGTTYKGERYKIESINNNWAKVFSDNIDNRDYAYISAESKYLLVKECLSEARTQDLKSDVLNYYDNLGVATAKDFVNVRKTASTNASIIGKLPSKAGCEILGTSGNFYKIKSGRVTGYVSKDYIASGKRAEDLALMYADLRALIKIDAVRVRTGPSTKYPQWTTVKKNELYLVNNQLDGWVELEIDGDSDKAFITAEKNYIEVRYALDQAVEWHPVTTQPNSLRNRLKTFATKYIGGKYVWGGNSLESGVDCSGFVQQIYKQFGVTLPRVSRDQATKGTQVKVGKQRVGDLVFYTNSSGVVDHVAIYIGNNQIVHAASTKAGIKISSWDYRSIYTIRDVLGNR